MPATLGHVLSLKSIIAIVCHKLLKKLYSPLLSTTSFLLEELCTSFAVSPWNYWNKAKVVGKWDVHPTTEPGTKLCLLLCFHQPNSWYQRCENVPKIIIINKCVKTSLLTWNNASFFQNVQVKAEISLHHRSNPHRTSVSNVYKTAPRL